MKTFISTQFKDPCGEPLWLFELQGKSVELILVDNDISDHYPTFKRLTGPIRHGSQFLVVTTKDRNEAMRFKLAYA